ncbi:MAG: 50S ribosomal protein L10 [Nitrososphaerota archaeon]
MSQLAVTPRRYPARKRALMEQLERYAREHECVAICPLNRVSALLINEYRKRLRGKVALLVPRVKLAAKVFSSLDEGLERLLPYLEGQVLLAFTKMDPFELVATFSELKISLPAKAGDIAVEPIIVPAGNTGLPPGPVLTEFREFKIPTRVEGGTVWVAKDTQVAKPGDVITPKLAALLRRFNLRPMKAELPVKVVLWKRTLIPAERLKLDLAGVASELRQAHANALALGLEMQYPEPMILERLLARAHLQALLLAEEGDIITPENAALLLVRAHWRARLLESRLAAQG